MERDTLGLALGSLFIETIKNTFSAADIDLLTKAHAFFEKNACAIDWLFSNRVLRTRLQPQPLKHLHAFGFPAYGRKSKPPALRVVVDSTGYKDVDLLLAHSANETTIACAV